MLQQAYARTTTPARSARTQLEAEQDAAVRDSIERFEATGSPIISDGEQRWSSFATYPVTDTLGRHRPGRPPRADRRPVLRDLRRRPQPAVAPARPAGRSRYKNYAADSLPKSHPVRPQADEAGRDRARRCSLLLYPLREAVPGYSRERVRGRIWSTSARRTSAGRSTTGAARVSIDFTEGRLATREDPRNPWTGAGHAVALHRADQPGVRPVHRRRARATSASTPAPAATATRCTARTCPYSDLLPEHVPASTPATSSCSWPASGTGTRSPARRRSTAATTPRGRADRLHRRHQPAEPASRERRRRSRPLVRAANYIPKEQLGSTDDCGFSPFSIDEKPSHGSPDYARDVAFQKISNRIEGTRAAAEKLGL